MQLKKSVRRVYGFGREKFENAFRTVESRELSRGGLLKLIPSYSDRLGGLGTVTYGEWCYTVGVFQSIIFLHLPQEKPLNILDIGCGSGRLYLSAKPFLSEEDRYTGLDISRQHIEICQKNFRDANVSFVHYEAPNAIYAASNGNGSTRWPLNNEKYNVITALSVWTHLRQEDWIYYLHQVAERLSAGGTAIVSFFVLDQRYFDSLSGRTSQNSRFYPQQQNKWVFDRTAYGSKEWYYPSWAHAPEVAIGVLEDAFLREIANAKLRLEKFYPGSWKEQPGLFFQDIAVLKRADP